MPEEDRLAEILAALQRNNELTEELLRRLHDLRDLPRLSANQTATFLMAHLTDAWRQQDRKLLRAHEGHMYSQNGEDGIIAEIFRRIGGSDLGTFIEIGAGNGIENNTRLLLEAGWRGLWIEGWEEKARQAAEVFASYVEIGKLIVLHRTVTPENINRIVAEAAFAPVVDFISVDVDQHTHVIWQALTTKALVHCIEYNASIPPSLDLSVPYDPDAAWDGTNYYGASLKTLERIGRDKGLNLVGCELSGLNAFFVDARLCHDQFREPFTAEEHYELPKYGSLTRLGQRPSDIARRWDRGE